MPTAIVDAVTAADEERLLGLIALLGAHPDEAAVRAYLHL